MITADVIGQLFHDKGNLAYEGEGITQLAHGWQCGQLALQAGADAPLRLAAWLHDLGHLLTDLEGTPTLRGIDDGHEHSAARVLDALWGPDVAEPVRLHVDAKRFLVATNPTYGDRLSEDSRRSLALQGGPMDAAGQARFLENPHARQAQQLRVWDDGAKRPGWFAADREAALAELHALMQQVPGRAA